MYNTGDRVYVPPVRQKVPSGEYYVLSTEPPQELRNQVEQIRRELREQVKGTKSSEQK